MELTIDQDKKLVDIQEEFHKRFPYLKIAFYKHEHAKGEASAQTDQLDAQLYIKEVQTHGTLGALHVHGLMTVAELEEGLQSIFGLSAQVFRKSGDIWLQTVKTDNWTLAEQNKKGREHDQNAGGQTEIEDYREQS